MPYGHQKTVVEQDEDFVQLAKVLALQLSKDVFDGAKVDIHLCDDGLNTIRVIVPL